jgi:hypothetical protein
VYKIEKKNGTLGIKNRSYVHFSYIKKIIIIKTWIFDFINNYSLFSTRLSQYKHEYLIFTIFVYNFISVYFCYHIIK